MMDPQAMVEEFHRKFDIAVSDRPSLPEEATRQLRVRLIQEEFEELQEAMVAQDPVSYTHLTLPTIYSV